MQNTRFAVVNACLISPHLAFSGEGYKHHITHKTFLCSCSCSRNVSNTIIKFYNFLYSFFSSGLSIECKANKTTSIILNVIELTNFQEYYLKLTNYIMRIWLIPYGIVMNP